MTNLIRITVFSIIILHLPKNIWCQELNISWIASKIIKVKGKNIARIIGTSDKNTTVFLGKKVLGIIEGKKKSISTNKFLIKTKRKINTGKKGIIKIYAKIEVGTYYITMLLKKGNQKRKIKIKIKSNGKNVSIETLGKKTKKIAKKEEQITGSKAKEDLKRYDPFAKTIIWLGAGINIDFTTVDAPEADSSISFNIISAPVMSFNMRIPIASFLEVSGWYSTASGAYPTFDQTISGDKNTTFTKIGGLIHLKLNSLTGISIGGKKSNIKISLGAENLSFPTAIPLTNTSILADSLSLTNILVGTQIDVELSNSFLIDFAALMAINMSGGDDYKYTSDILNGTGWVGLAYGLKTFRLGFYLLGDLISGDLTFSNILIKDSVAANSILSGGAELRIGFFF